MPSDDVVTYLKVPCPKCGQPIPNNVSVCHHCSRHLGFWGWLGNASIAIGIIVAAVSLYSMFQTSVDRLAVENALVQSEQALKKIREESVLRKIANVEQRWDVYRSQRAARINGCKTKELSCDLLMRQEVQDLYFFVVAMESNAGDLPDSSKEKFCSSSKSAINLDRPEEIQVLAVKIFPSLKLKIDNACG